jgi:hypothetical protein
MAFNGLFQMKQSVSSIYSLFQLKHLTSQSLLWVASVIECSFVKRDSSAESFYKPAPQAIACLRNLSYSVVINLNRAG